MSAVAAYMLLLASITIATADEANYVAIVPSIIRPGTARDISVVIMDHVTSDVDVTASLTVTAGEQDVTLTASTTCEPGSQKSLELNIPNDLEGGAYLLTLEGSGGVTFTNSTEVRAELKFLTVLVQTDKATYKPGDLIRFRAMAVYSDMTPYLDFMEIFIMDANENKIRRYPAPGEDSMSPNSETGVFEGELQLAPEPVQGTWKIKVDAMGQTKEKEIVVEEYVLPKYEVKVTVPDYLHDDMHQATFSVEAKYTYGQPVDGQACFAIAIDPQYDWNIYRTYEYCTELDNEGKASVTLEIDPELTELTGCYSTGSCSFTISRLRGQTLKVDVEVTETLTGNTLEGSKTVEYAYNRLKLTFLESTPDTFKPGLTYTAFAQLAQFNDAPLAEADLMYENGTAIPLRVTFSFSFSGYENDVWVTRNQRIEEEYEVGPGGLIKIDVSVPTGFSSCSIDASYTKPQPNRNVYASAYKSISKFLSRDSEGIQVGFEMTRPVQRDETVTYNVKTTHVIAMYYWEIYSKGSIVAHGVHNIPIGEQSAMTSTFDVTFDDDLATAASPNARILVYYFTDSGEIVADSIEFQVDALFHNQVSLSFDAEEDLTPRDNVTLTVTAHPGSYVGLLAVDKSVTLLRSGNDLSQDEVNEDFAAYDSSSTGGYYPEPMPFFKRRKRSIWCRFCWWPIYSGGKSAAELFENAGIVVFTDGYIHEEEEETIPPMGTGPIPEIGAPVGQTGATGPVGPTGPRGPGSATAPQGDQVATGATGPIGPSGSPGASESDSSASSGENLAEAEVTRTSFTDTWLWADTVSGDDGSVALQYTVPDTITSWVASAFAMHPEVGLGISEQPAEVTVFKPFFASMNLPYSIIRGERFRLQVIVFNYLQSTQNVLVTLKASTQFNVVDDDALIANQDVTDTVEVEQGAGGNVYFWIEPINIGPMDIEVVAQTTMAADALRRTIPVEPEGVEQTYVKSWFVDLSGGGSSSSLSETFTIGYPDTNLVAGSERIRVSAMADLMGTTMTNLDSLLRMPSGCGEQNMLGFAPNMYVMDYLRATDQSTFEIEERAKNYMLRGYQNELTFQRNDGSFSAFGQSDNSGSTWLSSFVIRCFNQARPYIYIDQDDVNLALRFIVDQQDRNGNFREPGRVIHTDMQGGSVDGLAMTAYVYISLLENSQDSNINDVGLLSDVEDALDLTLDLLISKLERVYNNRKVYELSIVTYALNLAAQTPGASSAVSQAADEALGYLEALSLGSGGVKYWTKDGLPLEDEDESCSWYCHRPKTNAIEMTAYGLLTYALRGDISGGLPVMKWLLTKQNTFGGYGSTQDTVIGIFALSKFASIFTSADSFSLDINIRGSYRDTLVFDNDFNTITNDNNLIYQRRDVDASIDEVLVTATGSGVALVQITVWYNILEEENSGINQTCFATMMENQVDIEVTCCASWMMEEVSGMVVSEIYPLSGYTVLTENFMSRNQGIGLKRFEVTGGRMALYFDELLVEETCFTVQEVMTSPVENLQDAVVRTYQYYSPDTRSTDMYLPEALRNVDTGGDLPRTTIPGTSSATRVTSTLLCFFIFLVVKLL